MGLLGTLSNWINWFSNNDEEGLYIETNGVVVVNKVDASGNKAQDGVYIGNQAIGTGERDDQHRLVQQQY